MSYTTTLNSQVIPLVIKNKQSLTWPTIKFWLNAKLTIMWTLVISLHAVLNVLCIHKSICNLLLIISSKVYTATCTNKSLDSRIFYSLPDSTNLLLNQCYLYRIRNEEDMTFWNFGKPAKNNVWIFVSKLMMTWFTIKYRLKFNKVKTSFYCTN